MLRPSVLAPVVLAFVVACGGDDDNGGNGGGGNGGGSDESYVSGVCSAVGDMLAAFDEFGPQASNPSSVTDLDELLGEMASAFSNVAGDLDDVTPPDDAAQAHEQMVRAIRATGEALEDGNFDALNEFDPGTTFALPVGVEGRLSAAAADAPECQGLPVFE